MIQTFMRICGVVGVHFKQFLNLFPPERLKLLHVKHMCGKKTLLRDFLHNCAVNGLQNTNIYVIYFCGCEM